MGTGRVDHAALAQVMSDYASALVDGGYDVTEVLDRLAQQAVTVLSLVGAGVLLRDAGGDLQVVTATDGRVRRFEAEHADRADGPGFHAFRSGEVIAVSDLETDDRWPDHHDAARAVGFRGTLALPMPVGRAPVGALTLYDSDSRAWNPDELDAGALLANMAAGYVVMARSLEDSQALTEQLQHALDSRVVIEQAKGMLAVHLGTGVDEAFERLRLHARSSRRRVLDVAQDVLDGRVTLDLADGAG